MDEMSIGRREKKKAGCQEPVIIELTGAATRKNGLGFTTKKKEMGKRRGEVFHHSAKKQEARQRR